MTKAELVSHVAAETSTTNAAAERMVGAVLSAIADALAGGETVAIAGFGTFSTRDRPAREGRNPRTGEPIAIAASRTPAFKPGKTLRDAVNRDRPRRFRQGGDMGIPAIRRSRAETRSHARRLNPIARGILTRPDADFPLRQRCAPLRMPNTGAATDPLSVTVRRNPEPDFRTASTKIPAPCTG